MPVTFTQTSPYLKTGILAECCNERMLSGSIKEKKGGVSGHLSTLQTVLQRQNKERKTDTHVQTQHTIQALTFSTICSKCINPINPASSH